jgi:Na+:H+ antiporter, NhaC family
VITALFVRLMKPLRRKSDVVLAAGASSVGVNVLTGEQYLSILLPGQMFRSEFTARGIPARTLSRTLEDCGTLVNPLIPWGVSGAFFASVLHVPVVEYLPYVPFLWLSPLLTMLYAYLPGLSRRTLSDAE